MRLFIFSQNDIKKINIYLPNKQNIDKLYNTEENLLKCHPAGFLSRRISIEKLSNDQRKYYKDCLSFPLPLAFQLIEPI